MLRSHLPSDVLKSHLPSDAAMRTSRETSVRPSVAFAKLVFRGAMEVFDGVLLVCISLLVVVMEEFIRPARRGEEGGEQIGLEQAEARDIFSHYLKISHHLSHPSSALPLTTQCSSKLTADEERTKKFASPSRVVSLSAEVRGRAVLSVQGTRQGGQRHAFSCLQCFWIFQADSYSEFSNGMKALSLQFKAFVLTAL
ncbi:hypothetical protein EJB05_27749, partial [Eragrostis curvula]